MKRHLSNDIISAFASGKLGAEQLIAVDDHLAACEECRVHALARAPDLRAELIVAAHSASEHLSFDALAPYVRGEADEVAMEIADLHLDGCSDCRAEVISLRLIEEDLSRDTSPAPEPAALPFGSRVRAFFGAHAIRLAFSALLLTASAVAVYWIVRDTGSVDTTEVAMANSSVQVAPDDPAVSLPDPEPLPEDRPAMDSYETARTVINDAAGELRMDANGTIIGTFAGEFDGRIAAALTSGEIPVPGEAGRLRSTSGTLMGASKSGPLRVRDPVGKILLSTRPQFRWSSVPGAESYKIEVFDGNYQKVAESPALSATTWQIGSPLARGGEYIWQVTATKGSETIRAPQRPQPDARFMVLSAVRSSEIERARSRYGRSNLVMGLVYANAGLIDEAEREFQKLAARNPGSPSVQRLLRSIRSKK